MVKGLFLVEGKNLKEDDLRGGGLASAKQIVIGTASGFGIVLHIAANGPKFLEKAVLKFSQVQGVTRITTLAIRNS
jgi:hypothetical protein